MRKHVLLDPVNYKIARDCNRQFHTHANSFGYDGRRSRNATLVQQRRTAVLAKESKTRARSRTAISQRVILYTRK